MNEIHLAAPLNKVAGIDRLGALLSAIDIVRRGGTISLIGVYVGAADPLPLVTMFDKQIQLRMGQANVLRWIDDIMPLLVDDDPPHITSHWPRRLMPTKSFRRRKMVKIILHP